MIHERGLEALFQISLHGFESPATQQCESNCFSQWGFISMAVSFEMSGERIGQQH